MRSSENDPIARAAPMAMYSLSTELSAEEVIERAVAFFGMEGIGLELMLRGDSCVRLVGPVGHVQVVGRREGTETQIELETDEWDYQVREFMRNLPRLRQSRQAMAKGPPPECSDEQ